VGKGACGAGQGKRAAGAGGARGGRSARGAGREGSARRGARGAAGQDRAGQGIGMAGSEAGSARVVRVAWRERGREREGGGGRVRRVWRGNGGKGAAGEPSHAPRGSPGRS